MERFKCKHCGYSWIPRIKKPKKCPKCQSWDWEGVKKND